MAGVTCRCTCTCNRESPLKGSQECPSAKQQNSSTQTTSGGALVSDDVFEYEVKSVLWDWEAPEFLAVEGGTEPLSINPC